MPAPKALVINTYTSYTYVQQQHQQYQYTLFTIDTKLVVSLRPTLIYRTKNPEYTIKGKNLVKPRALRQGKASRSYSAHSPYSTGRWGYNISLH